MADEYFQDEQSLSGLRNSFLDLLGDVFFVVPGLVTARYHRGESPSHPTAGPQCSEARGRGVLAARCLAASSARLAPSLRGTSPGVWDVAVSAGPGNSPAFQSSGMLVSSCFILSFPFFRTVEQIAPSRNFLGPVAWTPFCSIFPNALALRRGMV